MARVKQDPQENYNRPLAVRLRELIADKGLSMLQLAKEIGVSRQAIGSYTSGDSVPDAHNLAKLAAYFGVTSDYLLGLSPAKRLETHGVTALDLGFSEKAIETLSLMKQTGDFAYFNWLLEHETGGFMEDAFEYTYGGRLFDQIVKLLRFSEQAHLWPEIQIDGIGQVTLSKAHRVSDSYPVSDLILRDIKTEVRYILNDLEDIFTRKGELSAGKEHFSRPSEYEVL